MTDLFLVAKWCLEALLVCFVAIVLGSVAWDMLNEWLDGDQKKISHAMQDGNL